jgi:hypothetical protein
VPALFATGARHRADDRAKVVGLVIPDVASWWPTLEEPGLARGSPSAQR